MKNLRNRNHWLSGKSESLTPEKFDLAQNYPNPFNPSTMIRFSVPQAGMVTLKVFNVLGEEVTTLINRELISGVYEVEFNASGSKHQEFTSIPLTPVITQQQRR